MADPKTRCRSAPRSPAPSAKSLCDKVTAGEVLAVIEAMKMETSVLALTDGVIDEIRVSAGDTC